jgi:hypothetical protein
MLILAGIDTNHRRGYSDENDSLGRISCGKAERKRGKASEK